MYRLCKVYHISGVNTSHEAAKEIMRISGADVSVPADLFDDVVYGEKSISSQDAEKVLNTYVSAYEAYRETKKKRRIKTA